ncbi:hypothetical protein BGW39_010520 [Mortierella sp. 14UC]|nr:hypothetical protein BGW39_010520 [Mortierella sp. 14UC]
MDDGVADADEIDDEESLNRIYSTRNKTKGRAQDLKIDERGQAADWERDHRGEEIIRENVDDKDDNNLERRFGGS